MTTPLNFFAHRDASTPCRELIEFLTDVPISRNGTDIARTSLRAYPRHTYSWDVVLPKTADKAALTALRTGEAFIVPLWCHAFQRPDLEPTAGIASTSPLVVALTPLSEGRLSAADAFAWEEGNYIAAPAAIGRPVSDSRSITYITPVIQRMPVSFRLVDFKEVVGAYAGPTSEGLPLLSPFTANWVEPAEQVDVNANAFDAGHLDLYDVRYSKRTFTLQLTMTSREQIIAFRQLIFALKGRKNPLRWAAPGAAESTWRLASDGVEISYLRPNLATCQLSLIELETP
jgi:hypothetical protein